MLTVVSTSSTSHGLIHPLCSTNLYNSNLIQLAMIKKYSDMHILLGLQRDSVLHPETSHTIFIMKCPLAPFSKRWTVNSWNHEETQPTNLQTWGLKEVRKTKELLPKRERKAFAINHRIHQSFMAEPFGGHNLHRHCGCGTLCYIDKETLATFKMVAMKAHQIISSFHRSFQSSAQDTNTSPPPSGNLNWRPRPHLQSPNGSADPATNASAATRAMPHGDSSRS